jgi:hypothetical protein
MWTEILAATGGLGIALIVVLVIHKSVSDQVQTRSATKTILSMEVVAFGLLMAAFALGEVSQLAQTTTHPVSSGDPHFGLRLKDIALVFSSLVASLLIYIAASRLISHGGAKRTLGGKAQQDGDVKANRLQK